jgi:putative peptidoglycan lipid II flippase
MSDSTHSIFHSAKRFFSGTILSRITGLLRDIVIAAAFGTGEAIAAFMVAFRFSHTPRRLLGEGALQSAFIPHFEELRRESPERAFQFFRSLASSLALVLSGIILVAMIGLKWAVAVLDLDTGMKEILDLTFLMMPSLFFICLYGLNTSLLQCEKVYFVPSVAPVAFNVIWIFSVCAIRFFGTSLAMEWLSFGIIGACCAQWLMTVPQMRHVLRQHLKGSFKVRMNPFSADVRRLCKPLLLGMLGVAAAQINSTVDTFFARYADLSGPAYLWYAIRFQQLPIALFGVALSGALLPPLSRAIKAGDKTQFRSFLEYAAIRTVGFMLVMSAALIVMGDACINIAYGRGDFGPLSIVGSTQCLWGYAVGLIPMTLILVLAPAFYAEGNYRIPTIGATLSVVLNIFLNALFIIVLGYGAASVAYATSISAWLNAAFLTYFLSKNMGVTYLSAEFYKSAARSGLMTAAASITAMGIGFFVFNDWALWQIGMGTQATFSQDFIHRFMNVTLKGLCFLAVWAPLVWKPVVARLKKST